MNFPLNQKLLHLWINLKHGVRLAFFRKNTLPQFIINTDQVILLVLFTMFLFVSVGYVNSTPDPTFNFYALAGFSQQMLGLFFAAFTLAKLTDDNTLIPSFIIQVLSLTCFFHVIWNIVSQINATPYDYYLYTLWILAVIGFTVFHHVGKNIKKTMIAIGAYAFFVISPAYFLPLGEFWYQEFKDDSYEKAYNSINQENIFYAQQTHINDLQLSLLPDRPGISDLYFVGFAGYASEDVFMKEIHYIKTLMDNKFDTKGRSVSLINNPKTVDSTPLATKSNLSLVLNQIGRKMNPDEDVLFLYLTSHGSKSHELSVSFWPLSLNQIKPEELNTALDQAGIKWRMLLVSACYSGGFIEPLKNSNTLILTASAPDRTSFGCGAKSDFTYFGREVFVEQLSHNYSFETSFEKAIKAIDRREKAEKLKSSMPQLYIGTEISAKLELLEEELQTFYAKNSTEFYSQ